MIIKFQNCNQKTRYVEDGVEKYDEKKDRLCSKNINFYPKFYESVLKDDPDIIVLAEVAKAENIFYEINKMKPNVYDYKANSDLLHEYTNLTMIQNKIMIIYNKNKFELIGEPDESEYIKEGKIDYLHLQLQRVNDREEFNVFGIRVRSNEYSSFKELNKLSKEEQEGLINKNRAENNKVNIIFENLLKKYENCKNFILAGDFNHGIISKYEKDNVQYSYNYQTLNQIVNKSGKYELLTKGVETEGDLMAEECAYYFNNLDWTWRNGYSMSPIDHFIISNSFDNKDFEVIHDETGVDMISLDYGNNAYACGVPDHREIRLHLKNK